MPAVDSLIEKARRGDRMALDRLLVEHAEPLRVHLLRGLPSRVKGLISVEDVVQETLAKAFLKIDRFRGESRHSFAAWLLAIGDMTLIDLVRRETRQARGGQFERQEFASDSVKGSLVDLLAQLPGEEKTGSQIVALEEGVAALQVAIAGLPHDQQQAIQLRLLQGKTLQETSAAMDRTPASIRSLIHRAKESLAEAMGRASLWLSRN
jgi:RNA polymerase sigma-70 factor (ECF subfamily)